MIILYLKLKNKGVWFWKDSFESEENLAFKEGNQEPWLEEGKKYVRSK